MPEAAVAVAGRRCAGNVWKIEVAAGERVAAGQTLVIVESMKMEIAHRGHRPRAACVKYRCQAGRDGQNGQLLALIETTTPMTDDPANAQIVTLCADGYGEGRFTPRGHRVEVLRAHRRV